MVNDNEIVIIHGDVSECCSSNTKQTKHSLVKRIQLVKLKSQPLIFL